MTVQERFAFDDMDNSFREITIIRSKFEEMASKINSLINDVYVAQMHQKDIELEMLVSQINPHFLYNVLQTIHGGGSPSRGPGY